MTTVILRSRNSLPEKRRTIVQSIGFQARLYPQVWSPPADLYEVEDAYIVRVEVAGMRQQDFSVSLQNDLLTIRGIRPDAPERRAYHQMEIRSGEFNVITALPGVVNPESAIAEYYDGFLTITLPKA
ncbi:MAG: heat-shock protein Hsp20 [Anaerolineae bacterium CG_4_9_14_3_um_filter_57_17]|nr:Hsp20/alpha crystallin family protein [bacterium]NCT20631.1 Hsp20/alpha crystallin family protein [bacterium]OIO85675.1 MAG: hypothetical protein AUK01_05505 [Anaerolineae bacterium CG2_30_57_67]PJB64590.1 MAG: heat-shock protein Hsp20 [Anaerolineae bacterium CG_4_9_14_3_um_filter_57_17]